MYVLFIYCNAYSRIWENGATFQYSINLASLQKYINVIVLCFLLLFSWIQHLLILQYIFYSPIDSRVDQLQVFPPCPSSSGSTHQIFSYDVNVDTHTHNQTLITKDDSHH